MYQGGLILEGGGMKGIYTAGVLDFFLEKDLLFSSVYGVSAGACAMCSYLSGQKGRARDVTVDYLDSRHYCSAESFLLSGDLFNVEMCYHTIPEYLNPFDYETYAGYPGNAYSVVTNVETGQAEYLKVKDLRTQIDAIRASASLPLVSRIVTVEGKKYLDGGIADSIPIKKSILDGNRKNVVILTKEAGYVRTPASPGQLALIKARYLKYPVIYERMAARHREYNAQMEYLYQRQARGEAFIIRPTQPGKVGRIEKNKDKLLELYRQGYEDGVALYGKLLEYLGKE